MRSEPDYKVLVMGAGVAGLGLAARLLDQGEHSFLLLEQSDRLGGTWRDNTYPGCACDVPSHLYWYSFDPSPPEWSRVYPTQSEVLSHLADFARRTGADRHIRLETRVVGAAWDEDALLWRITTASGEELTAQVFVSACGQLSQPSFRGIAGRERFTGTWFHSARWRHDVDLTGKRVACVGSGASAAQLIPEVARVADRLTVFQRSAPYVLPRDDRAYTEQERRAFREEPEALAKSRAEHFAERERMFLALIPGSPVAQETVQIARGHLEAQVPDRALREKLWPDYDFGCKRPVISDDYLPAFTRDNVELVTEPVAQVEPAGVRDATGVLHEVDVIVYSTGFESLRFLDGVAVTVGDRTDLHRDAWASAPEAYLGMTVAGFPNFFILYGPNTNLNHNSIIMMFEAQYSHLLEGLAQLDGTTRALEVRPDVLADYNTDLQHRLAGSAFTSGCSSWYISDTGRIVTNWWGTVVAYRDRATPFDPADYRRITLSD
ncbi:flavin-containing monooxygenase [Streptomyces griseoaurantiacus]|uniref:flavin-containing monooxygenase n=1 Tax=Streptomyces griseoaurantiacus TaxID=68213 RepID=UPI0037927B60